MSTYRVYFLNAQGHITNASWIESHHDEAAIACVNDMLKEQDVELWQAARKVACLKAERTRSNRRPFNFMRRFHRPLAQNTA